MSETIVKRSIVVVDRRMQYHYLLVWVLSSLAIIGVLALFAWYQLQGRPDGADAGPAIRFVALNSSLFVLFSIVMGIYGVLHTHRIAGATHNLRATIAKAAAGDLAARVRLRETDYLQDLARDLNGLLEQRQSEVADLARAANLASSLRGVLELEPGASDDARKLAARVSRALEGTEEAPQS